MSRTLPQAPIKGRKPGRKLRGLPDHHRTEGQVKKQPPIPAIREKVFAFTEQNDACVKRVLIGYGSKNPDLKLTELTIALAFIAAGPESEEGKLTLVNLFGFTFGWLMQLGVQMPYNRIHQERFRQEELFRQKKHLFSVASPVVSPARKLRVLVEEIGEVAEAIDKIEFHTEAKAAIYARRWKTELVTELVQVAAVLCAWLESLEVQS